MLRSYSLIIALWYLGVCAAYLNVFLKEDTRLRGPARIAGLVAVLLHLSFLLAATIKLGHHPITSVFEAITTLAFMISVLFLYLDLRVGTRSTGAFVFLFVFVIQLVSALFMDMNPGEYKMLPGVILPAHIYIALAGYAAFTLSFMYSVMYVLLHRDIRAGRFGKLFRRFPALEELDLLNFRAVLSGLAALVVSIILGFVWYYLEFEGMPFSDAKVMFTLFAAALYAIIVLFRYMFGWQGRRISNLSIIGFVILMISFTLVNALAKSFHAHF